MHIELRKALDILKGEIKIRLENIEYYKSELANTSKGLEDHKAMTEHLFNEQLLLTAAKQHYTLFNYAIEQSLNGDILT
jgi:hypothetical protein